ncbi:MAG: hypothetical protein O6940_14420 [Ignavibacteria bacterium]|nr:hypothetical protein [Ignavibacteria bacterium]
MTTTTTWILIRIDMMIVFLPLRFMYFGRKKTNSQILLMKDLVDSKLNSYETSMKDYLHTNK